MFADGRPRADGLAKPFLSVFSGIVVAGGQSVVQATGFPGTRIWADIFLRRSFSGQEGQHVRHLRVETLVASACGEVDMLILGSGMESEPPAPSYTVLGPRNTQIATHRFLWGNKAVDTG